MSGSKNMSYDSASLTVSNIHWLGVLPSDLDRYNIPEVRHSPTFLSAYLCRCCRSAACR